MDDTPQNGPGIQQEPAGENKYDYQQYLGPDNGPPKNRRKFIIIGIAGVFIILIIILAAVLLTGKNKSGQDNQQQSRATTMCQDKSCLEQNFAQCLPAEYTFNSGEVSKIKYRIIGPADVGCTTETEYLANKYLPELAGKKMTCDFDNTSSFSEAVGTVFLYPYDFNCQGDLASALSGLDNAQ
ncbi:MAG TPA: hypothetical protein VFW77_02385 [Candidatus Saccharimonadales bacterium]|nr:hypothetical protein [Candidatus Saccharimonadales bacterium]